MVQLIKFYRRWLSPLMPPRCRFFPTCSEYALGAIHTHGSLKGSLLATKRLCRCHPLSAGGYDPVPESINHACGETPGCKATGNQKS